VVAGVLSQMPHGVGAADRVGLAQEVVADANVAVRVGAAELGESGTGTDSHL
jgi:hypothetical protein